MFHIPEGVDELEYDDNNFEYSSEDFEDSGDGTDDTDYADRLDTPQILGIINQFIKEDDSGKEVVDVVFNVEEITGATDYHFRVTKR